MPILVFKTVQEVRLLIDGRLVEYICRSSASWEDDTMLSVTYDVQSRYTYAVLYGCPPTMRERVLERLDAVEAGAFHPMLLPTIFADLERDRQVEHARTLRARLVSKAWNIPALPHLSSAADNEQGMRRLVEYATSGDTLGLWTKMTELRNGLHDWQDQVGAMIEHIDSTTCAEALKPLCDSMDDSASASSWERTPTNTHSAAPGDLSLMSASPGVEDGTRKIGIRIRHRLCEIHREYWSEMRKCSASLDVTSLASQVVSTALINTAHPRQDCWLRGGKVLPPIMLQVSWKEAQVPCEKSMRPSAWLIIYL